MVWKFLNLYTSIFLICEMEIIVPYEVVKTKWVSTYKVLQQCLTHSEHLYYYKKRWYDHLPTSLTYLKVFSKNIIPWRCHMRTELWNQIGCSLALRFMIQDSEIMQITFVYPNSSHLFHHGILLYWRNILWNIMLYRTHWVKAEGQNWPSVVPDVGEWLATFELGWIWLLGRTCADEAPSV